MSDQQTLNEQVFGDGLPMFPPHLCCCGTSAIGRASHKRDVASEPLIMRFLIAASSAQEPAPHGRETLAGAAYHATLRGLLERMR